MYMAMNMMKNQLSKSMMTKKKMPHKSKVKSAAQKAFGGSYGK